MTWAGTVISALEAILAVAGVASMLSKSEPKDVQAAMRWLESLSSRVVQVEAIEYGLFAPLDEVKIGID